MQGRLTRTLAGALVALAPATLAAQVERSCDAAQVMAMTPEAIAAAGALASLHPRRVEDDVAPLVARGDWAGAMATLVRRGQAGLALGGVDPAVAARYEARLARLERTFALVAALPSPQRPDGLARGVGIADFTASQGQETGDFVFFAGTPDSVRVTGTMSPEAQRALCWPAIAAVRLVNMFSTPERHEAVRALDALAARWEAYVENSRSQLPWELALNGWLRGRSGYEPPTQQLVFLHPSVGIEANGSVWKELRRVDVAVIEPLGWIFRYNADYTRYLGVSSAVSLGSNRNVAVGGYAHLWFPQAKLGYVVRSDPDRRRRGSVLVSVDLYDLLTGAPEELKRMRDEALGRKVREGTP